MRLPMASLFLRHPALCATIDEARPTDRFTKHRWTGMKISARNLLKGRIF